MSPDPNPFAEGYCSMIYSTLRPSTKIGKFVAGSLAVALTLAAVPTAAQTFTSTTPIANGTVVVPCGQDGDLYRYGAGRCPGPLFGANLSGAEAASGDAVRPSLKDLKGYIDRFGFKLIRYPFIDSRMTPARIAELRTFTDIAGSKGVPVILDNHTYRWPTVTAAVAFWTGFARNFPDDGSVILDPVNEPQGFNDPVMTNDWMQWARDSNAIIAGLRANGIRHPIALEYPQWSATFRFDKNEGPKKDCVSAGCALDRSGGLRDPLKRTYINGHRYFDNGASGTSKACKDTVSGWVEFAAQLRKRGLKAYITEVAFGSSYGVHPTCEAVSKEAVAALRANSDVLLGVTWWGGGRIWPESYIFKIDPKKAERFTAPVPVYTRALSGQQ
jgi:hypothetical protein